MALNLILIALFSVVCASSGEMSLSNVTRLATGDLFSLVGTDCGPTRCMEMSHGTALGALGDGCVCRCRRDTPTFREDQRVCVNHIDECLMASFGRGSAKPQIPFVFLPLKGQIIYPSKEIIFTDVENAVCAVTSAQYLSLSGWVTLRDLIDNDVPFGLYRDEGSTFLQWRGSAALHSRLEGRLVAVHVLCSSSTASHMAASCAAFRVAGASHNTVLDVRSIPFHAGEIITTESSNQSQGLSVLEALAIGVCVLLLIFVYAAGIIFYIHYKQRQKKKKKDLENSPSSNSSENGSALEARIDMSNVTLKTNPLLKLGGMGNDFMHHDSGMSDSERNDSTLDSNSSNQNSHKFQKMNSNVISAMVHSRKKKPSRPSVRQSSPNTLNERLQRRSASPDTFERAPHSDLPIIDCSIESHNISNRHLSSSEGEPIIRKKLYFNPLFFETEHLKDPPPAAVEFLEKIREVMSIAKEKMTAKRFVPMLSDIPEEDFYHAIDLGWDIPCARRGRRFSAISLKQENSRKSVHCGGCPGCDNKIRPQKAVLTRSNSCKSCVSEDYKQRIVRKWLDEVPLPNVATQKQKSVAKVNGTPRIVETKPKLQEESAAVEVAKKEESKRLKVVESIPKKIKKAIDIKDIVVQTNSESESVNEKVTSQNDKLIDLKKARPTITLVTPPQEKKPSSHASRRIRKKLPPPPPPPPPTKPPVTEPEEMNIEEKDKEEEPIPAEVKVKMEAVIKELNTCRRVEPTELEEMKLETISPIEAVPKIVIPVVAADSQYYSDDNMLTNPRRKHLPPRDVTMDFDSLERTLMRRRRFSLACGPELRADFGIGRSLQQDRLTSSWFDMNKEVENDYPIQRFSELGNSTQSISEIVISSPEPIYDNICQPGPLTIQVRGSPVESRRNKLYEDFDPDTLDRKPNRHEVKKRVEKILLKSAGSFKYKSTSSESESPSMPSDFNFKNKIGNLRQIYESKAKAQEEEKLMYKRRGSLQYTGQDLADFMRALKTPDLIRHLDGREKDPKPPVAPKMRRGSELSPKFSALTRESPPGERRRALEDRFSAYSRAENLNARRSGRRSARTRSRRTDIRKLYRTEDSGYMSTDSNESKRRAKYYLQLKPKHIMPEIAPMPLRTVNKAPIVIESDTDELESLGDGRSESGGESIETDSVFFGNFDDSKELLAELGINSFGRDGKMMQHEQIDSGFVGETNIILSGDSDSEHRSVISIMTGKTSATPIKKINSSPYRNTIEC